MNRSYFKTKNFAGRGVLSFLRRIGVGKAGFLLTLQVFSSYGYSPELIEAVLMADTAKVKELVSDSAVIASLNERDDYGNTALHYAAGQTEDPVQQTKRTAGIKQNGFNSLKEFQSAGVSAQIVQILVSAGASPDEEAFNDDEKTPLHIAVENCDKSLIEALIKAGADVNTDHWSAARPPLYSAVDCDDIEVAAILIKNKADINGGAIGRETDRPAPLFSAVNKGRWDIVELLAASGMSVTSATKSLNSPAWSNFVSWSKREDGGKSGERLTLLLLNAGAVTEGSLNSPLFDMIINSYTAAVRTALNKDPFLIHAVTYEGRSPLHYTVMMEGGDGAFCRPELTKTLLAFKADPNILDEDNRSAFHWAAVNNCVEAAGALRSAGASAQMEDKSGMNPYKLAVQEGSEGVQRLFTAELHQAAFSGDAHKIVRLIRLGLDLNAVGANERSALHWAAEQGHRFVAERLLSNGEIDINREDSTGQTPYCLAHINGHEETARLIKEKTDLIDRAVMAVVGDCE